MVDIQTVSIAAASAGVLVAAIYYMLTLRYNVKARQMELCRLITSDLGSEQGCQRYAMMMNMEWKDYEDFREKHGYSNPEMFGKWVSEWLGWENMGALIRSKVVTAENLYATGGVGPILAWEKFKDIIQSRRDAVWGQDLYVNFEFLAQEMLKIKMKKDASFKDKLSARLTKTGNTRPTNQNQ